MSIMTTVFPPNHDDRPILRGFLFFPMVAGATGEIVPLRMGDDVEPCVFMDIDEPMEQGVIKKAPPPIRRKAEVT